MKYKSKPGDERAHDRGRSFSLKDSKLITLSLVFENQNSLNSILSSYPPKIFFFSLQADCQITHLYRRKSHNRQDKMTKALLLSMVENDEHPFYTRDDLEMIRAAQGHYR